MKRRQFISHIGGAAALPLAARAQERVRRIGVLNSLGADNPESQARLASFLKELEQLGWTDGRNMRIDYRAGAASGEPARRHVAELIALPADLVLANGTAAVVPLLE